MSEAITNARAGEFVEARSAGSQPVGEVHPLSLKYLEKSGYQTQGLQSQSWDEFESYAPDIVVTVCDSAAGETCPLYFKKCIKVHWGLADPSKVNGNDLQVEEAFLDCIQQIATRADKLKEIVQTQSSQPTSDIALLTLKNALEEIA